MGVLSKKYFVFNRQDTWVLMVVVLPYLVIVNYFLIGSMYFSFPLFIWATLVSSVIGTCSWASHIIAANVLKHTITNYSQTGKRLLIQVPVYILLTLILGLSLFSAFYGLDFITAPFSWLSFKPVFISGIMLNVVATSFHEGLFAFEKWKASTLEAEQLKRNYIQSQFEGLKSQVNPHFLFNSLNSLSALIYSDQEKAGSFLDEMSKVYRYLLRSNENELIPLSSEIHFVHSFFHMLKTRYDEGIELKLNIQEQHMQYLIPPLTLQMLIENAIKHNVISRERPLKIEVMTDVNDMLIVCNNIQKKSTKVLSNGIGLQNILTKYQLLNNSAVSIYNDDVSFVVKLPLFKNV
ncbi:sensor histidine kinase [Desertivirga xinjiangensis]|uniref:sensor histidine kinase n=1 Tax=Desertivirga xinjiangensis TaxID=539206 RepID=UPI0021092F54|nr:histidine kinase [Pedobacter xinjiangensis]